MPRPPTPCFVYILRSLKTGRHYIGRSHDPTSRLAAHNAGKAKATAAGTPWKIVHLEQFPDETAAARRERHLKSYNAGRALQKLLSRSSRCLP